MRPRIKGRFATREEVLALKAAAAAEEAAGEHRRQPQGLCLRPSVLSEEVLSLKAEAAAAEEAAGVHRCSFAGGPMRCMGHPSCCGWTGFEVPDLPSAKVPTLGRRSGSSCLHP